MAPATRMSGNFAASQSANIDHILENFNQFKRKHITQNRDIIKTNALAQLRIKELEDKVLQLEGERAEKNLEMIRIRANMDRVERASKSMMRGWQLVGAGLAALTSIEGLRIAEPSDRVEQEAKDILRGDSSQQPKQNNRIILDPQALPTGVARSVSRPPEAQLVNVMEEDSIQLNMETADDVEEGIDIVVFTEGNGTIDETNRSALEDETIRYEAVQSSPEVVKSGFKRKKISTEITHLAPSRPPIQESRQDTSLLTPSYGQPHLRHSASVDSLSSFADEEEVQLSDDLCEEDDSVQPAAPPISKAKPLDNHVDQRRFTKPLKRRESTMSPDRSNEKRSTTPNEMQILSSSDGDSPNITRSSRRSSARDRKSINYALPKLNTKMRKPDPGDMIPAQIGETRRKENSSGEGSGGSIDETPRRALRGGSEVASTGNLREIAKQHQSSRKEDISMTSNDMEQSNSQQRAQQQRRRRSSSGQASSRASPENDRSTEWEIEQLADEIEDTTLTGKEHLTTSLPPSWKTNPTIINNHTFSKSATNRTPIPKNHAGQNIKALKVANRIQKQGMNHTPNLPSSDAARSKVTNRPGINGSTNGATGERVLHTSSKVNQSRIISPISSENTKRNSLHAAMTLEVEGQ